MASNTNFFYGKHMAGDTWSSAYDITDPEIAGADYSVEIKNSTSLVTVTPQSSIDGNVWIDGTPMVFPVAGKQSGTISSEAYVRFKLEGADYDIIIVANPVPAGGGGASDCPFNGVITIPSGSVSGTTCEDFKDLFFASVSPTVSIRATNISVSNSFDGGSSSLPASSGFGTYVIGSTITIPEIEGRPTLGANPAGTFTTLDFERVGAGVYSTTASPTTAWNNDTTDSGPVTTDQQFRVIVTDSEARTANASNYFRFSLPHFGTTVSISTLAPALGAMTASYRQLNMVAESGANKHTADFPVAFGAVTGVEFFNTVSGSWEWMNGSAVGSLTLFTQTATNHTMDADSSLVNYTKYTHNGVLTGAVDLRFHF